jgi:hypothetical protein
MSSVQLILSCVYNTLYREYEMSPHSFEMYELSLGIYLTIIRHVLDQNLCPFSGPPPLWSLVPPTILKKHQAGSACRSEGSRVN